jgi:hypothetical protein
LPSAGAVARIAARQLGHAGFDRRMATASATPLYLRNNIAQTTVQRQLVKEGKARALRQSQPDVIA